MAIAGNPVVKALTMSDSCLLSFPSLGNSKTIYSCHAVPSKPIKLHRSCCSINTSIFLPTLSLRKKTHVSSITTFVAHTSDWAAEELQQLEQDEEAEQEEPIAENGNLLESEPSFPERETEGEDYLFGGEGAEDGVFEEREDGDYLEPAGDGDFVEPPEDAKLFVGNLPYDVDCDALAALFDQAGTVEIAEVIYNRETERSRGFGFVTMSTVAEAEKAVEKFHQYDMGGRFLTVNKAAPRGARVERPPREVGPSFTVYVGNLPWDVDDARLQQIFGEHGKVTSARVIYDRETNRSRGFAFVTMATEAEMNDAVAALDGQSLDGRTIRVSVAENRPRR